MTEKELFREIGNIKEEYVVEAQEYKRSVVHNMVFRRSLATVACLLICLGIYWGTTELRSMDKAMQENAIAPESCMDVEMAMEQVEEKESAIMVQSPVAEEAAPEETVILQDKVTAEAETSSSLVCISAKTMKKPETEAVQSTVAAEQKGTEKENNIQENLLQQMDSLQEDAVLVLDTAQGSVQGGYGHWEAFLDQVRNSQASVLKVVYYTQDGAVAATVIDYDTERFQVSQERGEDIQTLVPEGKTLSFDNLYLLQEGKQTEVIFATEENLTREQLFSGSYSTLYLMRYTIE